MRQSYVFFIWLIVAVPALAQSNAVFPNGASFGLLPFEGSRPAENFSGFMNPETLASVMIAELPVDAADQVMNGFRSAASLAQQGIIASDYKELVVSGRPALQLKGTQQAQGLGPFPKCVVIVKGRSATGIITAQMPLEQEGDACRLIQGLAERAAPGLNNKVSALPFRITALGDMRIQDTLSGSVAILTRRDADPKTGPIMVIAHSLSQAAIMPATAEQMLISRQMLSGTTNVTAISIEAETTLKIDGSPATQIIATGIIPKQNRQVRLVQWVRFSQSGSTIRLYGESDQSTFDGNFAIFTTVKDGLKVP
ncbi:MAG: hypothetical protein AAF607_05185 [Pseudomonadota bacterium]